MPELREALRRFAPQGLRRFVRSTKRQLRGPQAFEVELGSYEFVPDPSDVPRISLIIPTMSKENAFGGVYTGLEIFFAIAAELRRWGKVDLRLLQTGPERDPNNIIAYDVARSFGIERDEVEVCLRVFRLSVVPTRRREIFVPFNWFCASNIIELLASHAAYFQCRKLPFLYPIQEYEPNLYEMSADHLLAKQIYDHPWPKYAVINSVELARWMSRQGHSFHKSYVLDPYLNPALRANLQRAPYVPKQRKIFLYARPNEARNRFPLLRAAIQRWANAFDGADDWTVVSAGARHPDITLPGGRKVEPLGKLSLDDYAAQLSSSAVGFSLMASPHPSYPPLEMAHFGLLTLTNSYTDKDLSAHHPNIWSASDVRPERLAEYLAEMCRVVEADRKAGWKASMTKGGFLKDVREQAWIARIAEDLRSEVLDDVS